MKKVLVSLICIGLLTGSMVSAVSNPIQLAKCAFNPNKYQCTKGQRQEALAWFIAVPAAVVVAALALIGIKMRTDQVKQAQDAKKQEVAAIEAQAGLQESPLYESKKDVQQGVQQLIDQGKEVDLSKEVGMF